MLIHQEIGRVLRTSSPKLGYHQHVYHIKHSSTTHRRTNDISFEVKTDCEVKKRYSAWDRKNDLNSNSIGYTGAVVEQLLLL